MQSRKRINLQDRGTLPKEEGDVVREYKAMYEENFLSNWLREVGEDKKTKMEVDRETKEEVSGKRTREDEKEENDTVIVKKEVCQSCFD